MNDTPIVMMNRSNGAIPVGVSTTLLCVRFTMFSPPAGAHPSYGALPPRREPPRRSAWHAISETQSGRAHLLPKKVSIALKASPRSHTPPPLFSKYCK